MNNALKYGFVFLAGAAVGAVASWQLLKNTYAQIADEEIESVKEVFAKKLEDMAGLNEEPEEIEVSSEEPTKDEATEYSDLVSELGYSDNTEKGGSEPMKNGPYIISAEEFGQGEYDVVSLNYYADGVLTDAWDDVIEKYEYADKVGEDFADHFGDNPEDPDTVYICNDEEETYYEILKDDRKFSDLNLMDDDE